MKKYISVCSVEGWLNSSILLSISLLGQVSWFLALKIWSPYSIASL